MYTSAATSTFTVLTSYQKKKAVKVKNMRYRENITELVALNDVKAREIKVRTHLYRNIIDSFKFLHI